MQKKEIKMGAYGLHQYVVNGTMWLPDDGCVEKVVHIVHGMTEHMGRYENFAEDLTPYGIAVVGFDLRGHGRNSGGLEAATFLSGQKIDDEYGWERSVEDIKRQIEKFQKTFPRAEYYLLGFSLGSFLVRDLIRTFGLKGINGVILAGTGYQPGIVTSVMKMVAKSQISQANIGGTTKLVRTLTFETYNKKFDPDGKGCGMEWLCSDTAELAVYMQDQLVRENIAADLFYEMMCAMHKVNKKRALKGDKNIRNIPILLISGSDDAVGDYGKGIHKVADIMEAYGAKHVRKLILKNARHDVFHEYESGAYDRMILILLRWLGVEL